MDGILIVKKEKGITSRDVVNQISKMFNTKKVGHTGTLDPFATGVLIITINKGTKISNFIEGLDKEYVATLKLGQETTTLDLEGEVISTKDIPVLNEELIKKTFNSFIGDITQIPPMYSAIKVNGVPLYKFARNNIEIERKERKVFISSIELLSFTDELITFKVNCSKGTYIRTLGNDIAESLNTVGHLISLERTRVGKFNIIDAKEVKDLTKEDIIPISQALTHLETIIVSGELEKLVRNGVKLYLKASSKLIFIKNNLNEPLAIYQFNDEDQKYHCLRGLF